MTNTLLNNIILNTDSYKTSHFLQYPRGTTHVSSYIESRGGAYNDSVFFGLQMFIQEYLLRPITEADIAEAKAVIEAHGLVFNEAGWRYILDEHNGYLPLEIQAVPEGTVLPVQNVMVQVSNTDPNCAWLTSYIETALLRAIWYPTTVATLSAHCRKIIREALLATSDNLDSLPFKLHDFGARGATSAEAAAIGGAAHLINFQGTDTISGLLAARQYYDAEMAGFSIPAAEHSTITCWGKDNEAKAYQNMLDQFAEPGKLVAVVSDSYDLWHAIDNIWGEQLKKRIKESGGTLVVRPDSGEPVRIVLETLERLMAKFGFYYNTKGYRVLPDYIRVIQGDGVSAMSIKMILDAMKARKLSAENIAFGMGAELLQKVNRDTKRFAMKASATKRDGLWYDVYKDPVTDRGKRSKKGRLALTKDGKGLFKTIREDELKDAKNLLRTVYRNGELLIREDFQTIRDRALYAVG